MKKFIIVILAVFYLGASSGATVHIHYCMGKLIDWGISKSETGKCSNCGMEKVNSEDCCKDQLYKITVKDSPKASALVYYFNTVALNIPPAVGNDLAIIYGNSLKENAVLNDSPPRTQATPAFIRNCTFRI